MNSEIIKESITKTPKRRKSMSHTTIKMAPSVVEAPSNVRDWSLFQLLIAVLIDSCIYGGGCWRPCHPPCHTNSFCHRHSKTHHNKSLLLRHLFKWKKKLIPKIQKTIHIWLCNLQIKERNKGNKDFYRKHPQTILSQGSVTFSNTHQ